jgi:hypothetical protein
MLNNPPLANPWAGKVDREGKKRRAQPFPIPILTPIPYSFQIHAVMLIRYV